MFNIIKLNEKDNIGIATMDIPENVETNLKFISKDKIPYGHKISLKKINKGEYVYSCLLYTSPSPRDGLLSRMPSSA